MHWLVGRDLAGMTRTPALWIVLVVQTVAMASMQVTWGAGIPVLTGSTLDQFTTVWSTVLAIILPWVAVRCSPDGSKQIAWTAALCAQSVRRVLLARFLAVTLMLVAITGSVLPLYILAMRITGGLSAAALWTFVEILALCPFVAAIVTAGATTSMTRLTNWGVSTSVLVLVTIIASPSAALIMIGTLAIIAVSLSLAERRLAYPAC